MLKIKKIINNLKKHFKKQNENIRWEIRYNNLNKKYEEALQEISNLKKELDNDKNVNLIKEKNKYIKTLQRQRDNLREDNKRLMGNE